MPVRLPAPAERFVRALPHPTIRIDRGSLGAPASFPDADCRRGGALVGLGVVSPPNELGRRLNAHGFFGSRALEIGRLRRARSLGSRLLSGQLGARSAFAT